MTNIALKQDLIGNMGFRSIIIRMELKVNTIVPRKFTDTNKIFSDARHM